MKKTNEEKKDNSQISSDIQKKQNYLAQQDKSPPNETIVNEIASSEQITKSNSIDYQTKPDDKKPTSNKTTVENNTNIKENNQIKQKEETVSGVEMLRLDKTKNETNIEKQSPPPPYQTISETENTQSNLSNNKQTTTSNNDINNQATSIITTSKLQTNTKDVTDEAQLKHPVSSIKSLHTLNQNSVAKETISGKPTKPMNIHDRNQQFNKNIGIPSSHKRSPLLRGNGKEKK